MIRDAGVDHIMCTVDVAEAWLRGQTASLRSSPPGLGMPTGSAPSSASDPPFLR